ncbi:hypothetical protein DFQ02_10275 [Seonamhaeicola aphaedonensis]|uniref:Uncharacterized protein n=1 Tax=Seonamhaeicola aphaedonensis TaxID=1461338 RepID=A0A3D9HIK0_9FLAO|nr:hypothetical protein DFQ02_10275 [Seonamhaeicola aphaedonensis]
MVYLSHKKIYHQHESKKKELLKSSLIKVYFEITNEIHCIHEVILVYLRKIK